VTLMGQVKPQLSHHHALWSALVLSVRDYVGKNRFPGALIGLSGGMDSALVLAIAVDALGADKVRTVMMPSPYTADISWLDARECPSAWACSTKRSISRRSSRPSRPRWLALLPAAEDTTEENLQPVFAAPC
jgi:NAD+ synthase (glutamine-hydrolysing)